MQCFKADTLDDLLHDAFSALLKLEHSITTRRGTSVEISTAVFELTNPLARLSRSEARGKLFSGLGELIWYLSGSDSASHIGFYVPPYIDEAVEGQVLGAYGPRLFRSPGVSQAMQVLELLRQHPTSRRAVLQIYDAADLFRFSGDVPCTCTIQFLLRDNRLNAIAYMRSNDAIKGLSHDVFCFTMIQELFAKALRCEIGTYSHIVGSLHLYEANRQIASEFLDEGFQSTKSPMPPMPDGDPWPAIDAIVSLENKLRSGHKLLDADIASLADYWRDIANLLGAYAAFKSKDKNQLQEIARMLSETCYAPFVMSLVARFQA